MKLIFENWQKFLDENDDPDSNADDAAELRDVADDLEGSGGSPDMLGLVEEHDLDYEGEPIGFFLSLVREASGAFMEQREQDLTEEMRQAVAKILSDASASTEPELNPEEEAWAETYDFFGKERPPR
jgi:hypothetical protein